MIDVPTPHWCPLPEVSLAGAPATPHDGKRRHGVEYAAPPDERGAQAGPRFTCPHCGHVWVLHWLDGYQTSRVTVPGHHEWQPETRREHRKRLRIPWWQPWR